MTLGLAAEAGMCIGQLIQYGINALWDPIIPLQPLDGQFKFARLHDLEIDTFLLLRILQCPLPSRVLAADAQYPQMGTFLTALSP